VGGAVGGRPAQPLHRPLPGWSLRQSAAINPRAPEEDVGGDLQASSRAAGALLCRCCRHDRAACRACRRRQRLLLLAPLPRARCRCARP
jgi:hypothetical protein